MKITAKSDCFCDPTLF